MNDNYYKIKGFNPRNYNSRNILINSELQKLQRLRQNGYVGNYHSLFVSEEQLLEYIEVIKLYDPMMALLCKMSYQYRLHPIHELGMTLRLSDKSTIEIGNLKRRVYPRRSIIISENDYRQIACLMDDQMKVRPVLLFSKNRMEATKELTQRWELISSRITSSKFQRMTVDIFSFYSTAIYNEINNFKDLHEATDVLRTGDAFLTEVLLESFGVRLKYELLLDKYMPPDPFI